MDIGCYLDNGRRPCNYSAHERCALDWLTPVTIGSPASVRLPNMDDKAFCVKIETGRENDYYLLENRVKTRFDNYLYGPRLRCGLCLTMIPTGSWPERTKM